MTNWTIEESESALDYLEKPEVVVGDTIEVMSNNQLGYKKYLVELDENGAKRLKTVADWGDDLYEERGGKKKRRKKTKTKRCKKSSRSNRRKKKSCRRRKA